MIKKCEWCKQGSVNFWGYDDFISERLSRTDISPSKARKDLRRHVRKSDPEERFYSGRKIPAAFPKYLVN